MPDRLLRYASAVMFLAAAVAVIVALTGAAGGKRVSHPLEKFAAGDLANLDFEAAARDLPDDPVIWPDGETAQLNALSGKALLVNYWATWCGPCERELPSLGALQTARGGAAFDVIALSVDSADDAEMAETRLSELTGGVLDLYHAPDYAPVYSASVQGFPTTIFYGPDGVEVFRLAGEADWSSYEAVALIDAALAAGSD